MYRICRMIPQRSNLCGFIILFVSWFSNDALAFDTSYKPLLGEAIMKCNSDYQSSHTRSLKARLVRSRILSKTIRIDDVDRVDRPVTTDGWHSNRTTKIMTSMVAAFVITLSASAADPIRDISGQDLSNGNYEQQDFTGVVAEGTSFQKSNLQGCKFNNAILTNADLSGADIRGASFQGSILDGAVLKDVNAVKTIFSESILDVGTLENSDLTDSLWPSTLQIMICDMPSLKGTSASGVNTRDSILCKP